MQTRIANSNHMASSFCSSTNFSLKNSNLYVSHSSKFDASLDFISTLVRAVSISLTAISDWFELLSELGMLFCFREAVTNEFSDVSTLAVVPKEYDSVG